MKTKQMTSLMVPAFFLGFLGLERSPAAPSAIPSIPVGVMAANPMVVQTGTKPTLNWNILYPSKVSDLVNIKPPGTLIPATSSYVTVQIVGTRVTSRTSSNTASNTSSNTSTQPYTEARVSLNGGGYQQLFYGTQEDVDPGAQLYIKKLAANDTIDFGGRFVDGTDWSPFYTTKSANFQVVALVSGQTPPTTFPLSQSTSLNSFLQPYLDATGKVNIGPMSVLILMELGQTNNTTSTFDLQDQVLLVTFSKKHPNNGHGNNLDGVDSSNPGQGHGGPNGGVDPSGGVDDEMK